MSEACKISVAELCSRIADRLYFVKIKDYTEPDFDLKTLKNEASLKGIFVKKMLERIDKSESQTEKPILHESLIIGLKAFDSEVAYLED